MRTMIDWREIVREILDSTWLLGLSSIVIASELLVRAVLSWEFSSLWIVAWPPVVTVVVFGLAATANRSETADIGPPDSIRGWSRQTFLFGFVAILGHAIALIAGAAVFFAVDTPLRLFVYWLGLDPANWPFAYLGLPLIGVAMGAALVWAAPATIAADVSRGTSLPTALRRLVTGVSRDRQFFDWLAVVNMAVVFSVVVSILLGSRVLYAAGVSEHGVSNFYIGSLAVNLAVTVAFAVVLVLVPLALAATLSYAGPARLDGIESRSPSSNGLFDRYRPMLTIVLVILLVVSLIAVAGTVRMAELRPMEEPEPEPLSDTTSITVMEAHQNLISYDYAIHRYDLEEDPDEPEMTESVNLQTREAVGSGWYGVVHAWTGWGGAADPESPTEAVLRADRTNEYSPYPGDTWDDIEEWRTVLYHHLPEAGQSATAEYGEDTITVETTAAEDILSETGHSHLLSQEGLAVEEAWMEIAIDRDTKTTREVEYRFDVQYETEDGEREHESQHVRYDVELDPDIEPSEERRTLEERVWRVLLY